MEKYSEKLHNPKTALTDVRRRVSGRGGSGDEDGGTKKAN